MSFESVGARIVEGALAGLYEAGTIIMAQSQTLVPVDTGTLKRTGQVEQPVLEGDVATVTVGYGTNYGFWVEVRDDLRHAPPTQAHYLGEPAAKLRDEFPGIIEHNIKAHLGMP